MTLSVVIASINDGLECLSTVRSIRDTAGYRPEIICVDDLSATSLSCYVGIDSAVKLITNKHRIGCGPSRHVGVLHASGEYVLLLDSHMRMTEGWYEEVTRRIEGRPHTLHVGKCLGLDRNHPDIATNVGEYFGGHINVSGPDKLNRGRTQVMEAVWKDTEGEDDCELAAPMGANYIFNREYFLKLSPLRLLRYWGSDELMLGVKFWLSGGDVRYIKNFRIGHRFALKNEKPLFETPAGAPTFNKLMAIQTLVNGDLAPKLMAKLQASLPNQEWQAGVDMMKRDWHLIAAEQALNRTLFRHPFEWLIERFALQCQL